MVAGTKIIDKTRVEERSKLLSVHRATPVLTDLYIARGHPAVEAPHEGFFLARALRRFLFFSL